MNTIKFALVAIAATVALVGCSSTTPAQTSSSQSDAPQVVTIEQVAEAGSARIGEYQVSYFLPPSGGISFVEAAYKDSFDIGEDKPLEGVVVVEVVTEFGALKTFLTDKATAVMIDEKGENTTDLWTATYRDTVNDKLFIVVGSDNVELKSYRYLAIGGFDADKNEGSARLLYEIK